MKSSRHAKILELITAEPIDTQEGLLERLRQCGYEVTQATVSRDIRELGLHKVRTDRKTYRYVTSDSKIGVNMSGKFSTIFTESVKTVASAQNIVVVRCFTGMANAACASLDASDISSAIVGTLSGDDTFLIIMADNESAVQMVERLKKLLSGR